MSFEKVLYRNKVYKDYFTVLDFGRKELREMLLSAEKFKSNL